MNVQGKAKTYRNQCHGIQDGMKAVMFVIEVSPTPYTQEIRVQLHLKACGQGPQAWTKFHIKHSNLNSRM